MKRGTRRFQGPPFWLLVLWPVPAFANIIMAQEWVYHRPWLIGVLLLIEFLMVSRFVHVPRWRAFLVILLANLWSAVWGRLFDAVELTKIVGLLVSWPVALLFPSGSVIWFGGAFVLSAILEWPWYWIGLTERNDRRAWRLTFLLNGASYGLLGLGTWLGWWWGSR